MAVIESAVS